MERKVSEHATQDGFKEQFPKNLLSNIAYFLINIIIGIFLVPYFIGTLGVAAYGLIPLATSFTSYVTILTDSLNIAVSRFLTVDIHQKNFEKANRTFNTALFGLSGVILLLIPVVVLLSYYAPKFFNVPAGQEFEVVLLFFGVSASFLIRSWSSNFTVSLFAYNRLDLLNLLNILVVIIQVSLIVVLFTTFSPQLGFIGFAYLVSSVVFLSGAIVLSKRINPHLRMDIHDFDRLRLKELTLMGWWAVVDMIGSLFFLQIDLIAVNLLFGATAAGEYAVVFVWATLLRGIAWTLAGVLSPMILTYYAKGNIDQIINISKSAVKGLGLVIALPIGLLCGFAPSILTLWLGPQFAHLAPLIWLLILPLVINLCILPLYTICVAFNKIRTPGIVTLFLGIGNVILIFTLPLLLGWGFYGVAISGAIMFTLKNTFFTPWYTTKIMGISTNTFTKSMIAGVIAALIIAGVTTSIGKIFIISSLINLAMICGVISVVYLIVIWFIGLNQYEREIVTNYIPEKFRGIVLYIR
jgi:O-antigen/teichoic acid export membrane protein